MHQPICCIISELEKSTRASTQPTLVAASRCDHSSALSKSCAVLCHRLPCVNLAHSPSSRQNQLRTHVIRRVSFLFGMSAPKRAGFHSIPRRSKPSQYDFLPNWGALTNSGYAVSQLIHIDMTQGLPTARDLLRTHAHMPLHTTCQTRAITLIGGAGCGIPDATPHMCHHTDAGSQYDWAPVRVWLHTVRKHLPDNMS